MFCLGRAQLNIVANEAEGHYLRNSSPATYIHFARSLDLSFFTVANGLHCLSLCICAGPWLAGRPSL